MGEPRKALDFYMIAAHLTPKDITLWHRLATLSAELGFVRQAIYCLGKARPGCRTCLHPLHVWHWSVICCAVAESC